MDEQPFELPVGWEWTTLGLISLINPRNCAEDGLPASFVPMTLIDSRFNSSHDQEARLWKEIKQGFTHFAEGDIGVAKITPCFENSKACVFSGLLNGVGAGTTELHVVRPFNGTLAPRYVLAYLKSPQFLLIGESKMTGTAGQKRLPKDFVESNPFPLPPLAEQHRIVAKVDELMALCDQLETQHSNAAEAHEKLVSHLLGTLTQSPTSVSPLCKRGAGGDLDWQRIAEHFDTLFTTEASIDALKQTLLQLAVMGKLVPQDPNDEPASELLKCIQDEKAKLVAEGKIKKSPLTPLLQRGESKATAMAAMSSTAAFESETTPPTLTSPTSPISPPLVKGGPGGISEHEMPFELPPGWECVRLEEISQVGTGATPLRSKPEYFNPAEISWVTSGETSSSHVFKTEQSVSKLALEETNLTVYPKGTLIVAMYGQGKTRGQITELMIEASTNQACAAIRLFSSDELHRKYIKLFFEKIYDEIRELAAGGAQPNLNLSKVKETLLPLPPLLEQHRIVAKVDELMSLCDQLKTRITQAKQLQQKLADVLVEQAVTQ